MILLDFYKKNKTAIIASLLFMVALFLRTYRLPEFIAYHQDQVRDLLYIKEHLENNQLILLGPKASVGNFFLAPLWYYLMGFVYLFSPSPVAPALLVAILNSAAVILIYYFVRNFFSNVNAVYASLLYAVSPFAIEYSRFAWNPNPIPFFTILTVYSLFIYIYREKKSFLYLAVVSSNFAFQLHYQGFLLVAAVFIFPLIRRDWKRLVFSAIIFLGLLTPFFLYEATNGYPNISQIFSFLSRTTQGRSLGIINSLRAFTHEYPEFLARVLFFGNKPLGLIFSIFTYFVTIKNLFFVKLKNKSHSPKFGLYLIFSILLLTLFAYRQWIVPYYLLVALVPVIIITVSIFEKYKVILIAIILINLYFSPAFSKTDSSYYFFKNSVNLIQESGQPINCVEYKINDPDLIFASSAVEYLIDSQNYNLPDNRECEKNYIFCESGLCDKIKGIKKIESEFLGLSLIER